MSAMNPMLGQALQNPQVRTMLSNPAMMQQMMAMQGGMGGMGGMGGLGQMGMPGAAPPGGLDFSSIVGAGRPLGGFPGAFPPAAPAAPAVDPAVQYAAQLQQLQDMGFPDATANLRALVQTRGNVNAAVERLFSS